MYDLFRKAKEITVEIYIFTVVRIFAISPEHSPTSKNKLAMHKEINFIILHKGRQMLHA